MPASEISFSSKASMLSVPLLPASAPLARASAPPRRSWFAQQSRCSRVFRLEMPCRVEGGNRRRDCPHFVSSSVRQVFQACQA